MEAFFASLKPAGEPQRSVIEQARSLTASIVQTHLLMGRQLHNPIRRALIDSVVLWATLVFCCVGLGATLNALAVIAELLGAVSVASAIFLILEFSQLAISAFRRPGSMRRSLPSRRDRAHKPAGPAIWRGAALSRLGRRACRFRLPLSKCRKSAMRGAMIKAFGEPKEGPESGP
jgi:hypothetical protein